MQNVLTPFIVEQQEIARALLLCRDSIGHRYHYSNRTEGCPPKRSEDRLTIVDEPLTAKGLIPRQGWERSNQDKAKVHPNVYGDRKGLRGEVPFLNPNPGLLLPARDFIRSSFSDLDLLRKPFA
jgi:hypothetical protein